MAKQNHEFRPDKVKTDLLGKLYLTPQQRRRLLRWFLFALLLTACSAVTYVQVENAPSPNALPTEAAEMLSLIHI